MMPFKQKRKVSYQTRYDRELGLWITYQLKRVGESKQSLADRLHVRREAVVLVSYGRSTSRRIRQAIAETLGYGTWEDLLDARRRAA
jgi:hypothetical protein